MVCVLSERAIRLSDPGSKSPLRSRAKPTSCRSRSSPHDNVRTILRLGPIASHRVNRCTALEFAR